MQTLNQHLPLYLNGKIAALTARNNEKGRWF